MKEKRFLKRDHLFLVSYRFPNYPTLVVETHQCITFLYAYSMNRCVRAGRFLVSGDLPLAGFVMRSSDLLQQKAQRRQIPLTDLHLAQRREDTRRPHLWSAQNLRNPYMSWDYYFFHQMQRWVMANELLYVFKNCNGNIGHPSNALI